MNVSCAVLSGETFCWTDEMPENPNTLRESMLKLLMCIVGISTMYYFPATFFSCNGNEAHPGRVRDFTRSRLGVLLKSAKFARLVA